MWYPRDVTLTATKTRGRCCISYTDLSHLILECFITSQRDSKFELYEIYIVCLYVWYVNWTTTYLHTCLLTVINLYTKFWYLLSFYATLTCRSSSSVRSKTALTWHFPLRLWLSFLFFRKGNIIYVFFTSIISGVWVCLTFSLNVTNLYLAIMLFFGSVVI